MQLITSKFSRQRLQKARVNLENVIDEKSKGNISVLIHQIGKKALPMTQTSVDSDNSDEFSSDGLNDLYSTHKLTTRLSNAKTTDLGT